VRSTASHGAPQADPGTGGRAAAQCGMRGGAEHYLAGAGRGEQAGRRFGRRRRRSRRVVSSGAAKQSAPTAARPPQPESDRAVARASTRGFSHVAPGDRRRAARPRTTRNHTRLHPPDRRGPRKKPSICRPSPRSGPEAARRVLMHLWPHLGCTPATRCRGPRTPGFVPRSESPGSPPRNARSRRMSAALSGPSIPDV
jgi:hypothetical protein